MKIGKEPHEIMEEMERGIRQNQRLTENGLYEDVEQYENFYAGRQWEGVNAPNLEKPVLNFTYRVVSYCISMLVSDDIGVEIRPFRRTEGAARSTALLGREVERAIERSRLKTKLRQSLKDAALRGIGIGSTRRLSAAFLNKQPEAAEQSVVKRLVVDYRGCTLAKEPIRPQRRLGSYRPGNN